MSIIKDEAKLEIIVGPMKSGKSFYMITEVERFRYTNLYNVKVFKPLSDKRDDSLKSRTGLTIPSIQVQNIEQVYEECENEHHDIVGIDEFHLFNIGNPEVFENYVAKILKNNKNTRFIMSGLDRDYRGELMANYLALLRLPHTKIKTLNAICETCNKDTGRFTSIQVGGIPLNSGLEQALSEEHDSERVYSVHCKECFDILQRRAKSYDEIMKELKYKE